MGNMKNDDSINTTKRDELIWDHLRELGIFSIEDAPDEFIESAHKYADSILGVGNDN